MNILACIPARGGSKSIPKKNIHPFNGKPLLAHAIEQALAIPAINRTVVSSDSREILEIAEDYGAQAICRPADIAGDAAKIDDAIVHALDVLATDGYHPDIVVLLQPTSPLRTPQTVERAIAAFQERFASYDSLMPVAETSNKLGIIENDRFIAQYPPGVQRQELRSQYYDCGTVHIFKPELLRKGRFFGDIIYPFVVPFPENLDVDTVHDIRLAEYLLLQRSS